MPGYGMMHDYGFGGMGLWGGVIGLIFGIAVLVGIVLLIVWGVRSLAGGASHWNQASGSQSAVDILKARYAAERSLVSSTSKC